MDVHRTAGARLYRNDLQVGADGTRALRFTDITEGSGLAGPGYGLGVAAGDVDNDGRVDLYVTGFDGSRLYRNTGHGTFTDITAASGAGNPGGFAVSAAFVDIDRDGWLDLYVANNVSYRTSNATVCPGPAGAPDYCPPQIYGGLPDRLYRNLGRGRFRDVTASALRGLTPRPGLGLSTADFDGDGWIDIAVANDGEPDFLWMNQRDGTLRDDGLPAGVALSEQGVARANMGVDAADYDRSGRPHILVGNFVSEMLGLYRNTDGRFFTDVAPRSEVGRASLLMVTWAVFFFDADNDGWLDVLAANGTIIAQEGRRDRSFPYDQQKLLFRNLANGRFEDVTAAAGPAFALSESGRGAAFGDLDNDGDVDVVVGNNSGPVQLLVNDIGAARHWLGLRLVGRDGRDMLGARVAVERPGQPTLWRRARADGSYGSANDPRVHAGLGDSAVAPTVRVRWPDGAEESWPAVAIDRWTTLTQGTGR